MADTETNIGCSGCPNRFSTLAEDWSASQPLVEQADELRVSCFRSNTQRIQGSPRGCNNDFIPSDMRRYRVCSNAEKISQLLMLANQLADLNQLVVARG